MKTLTETEARNQLHAATARYNAIILNGSLLDLDARKREVDAAHAVYAAVLRREELLARAIRNYAERASF
jgi:hypothetical protein